MAAARGFSRGAAKAAAREAAGAAAAAAEKRSAPPYLSGPGRGSSVAAAAFISSFLRWRMERFLKQASVSR